MKILSRKDIICFGPSDWWGMNPSCATHIMRYLSRDSRIFYINPISSDILGARGSSGFGKRLWRKLKSLLKYIRRVDRNIYVLSPLFLPVQGVNFIDYFNNILLKIQIFLLKLFFKINNPILWVENIRAVDIVPSFKWHLVIYHNSDDFTECPYTFIKKKLLHREQNLTKASDLIVCVSKNLFNLKNQVHDNVHYLRHGVDYNLFRKAVGNGNGYKEISHIPHPVVGYFGTLTAQNDIDILEYCAAKLKDISFIFAGKITAGDYSGLFKMSNVYFPGYVPYEYIPSLCAGFDVCIMAWRKTKWIENCNPLKLFEYMASGNPIVSVSIEEVNKFSDIISITDGKEEFCEAIRRELNEDTVERQQKRIAVAADHSWKEHEKKLSEIINSALEKKYS